MLVTPPVVNDVPQILGRMPSFGRGPIRDRLFGHFKQNARGRTFIWRTDAELGATGALFDWPEQMVPGDPEQGDVWTQTGLVGIPFATGYPFNIRSVAELDAVEAKVTAAGEIPAIIMSVQGGKVIDVDEDLFTSVLEPYGFTEVT